MGRERGREGEREGGRREEGERMRGPTASRAVPDISGNTCSTVHLGRLGML